jgi:hypothetical protein
MQYPTVPHITLEPLDNVRTTSPAPEGETDAAQHARHALELAETAPDGTRSPAPNSQNRTHGEQRRREHPR